MRFRSPLPLRTAQAGIASVTWFGLLLQLYCSIRQSIANGGDALHGLWMYFAFFTVLTNLLVALVLTLPLVAGDSPAGRFCSRPSTIAGVAANIALVGIAYNLLLRDLWHPQGLQLLADVLLHDAVPIAFVVWGWLVARRSPSALLLDRTRWGLWPIGYFVYAMARGAASGFYAYPFIHVGHLGVWRVLLNASGIFFGFLLVVALLFALERIPARRIGT